MRKILLCISIMFISVVAHSQNKQTTSLSIRVLQPEREYLTAPSCRLLHTKMTQILTQNDIVNDLPSNRFVMTAKANVLNKDINAGSPSRISEKIELTFIIGDVIDNIKYGTYSLELTGVGLNENQAIQMAIKTIKNNDPGLKHFIETSKERIVNYYKENEAKILNQADVLASGGNYAEAVYLLSLVPDASLECYEHCQNKILELNQHKLDQEGEALLAQAKAAWAKNPNGKGAEEVYPIISHIDPRASCYKNVSPFLKQIKGKLVADEQRAWDFKIKQYEDEKAKEQRDFELRVQQYNDEKAKEQRDFEANQVREQRNFEANQERERRNAEIRKREISAARDVAKEYARNQPQNVTYETILLW